MPRDEARAIFDLIEPIGTLIIFPVQSSVLSSYTALSIDPKLSIRIMGSYRRLLLFLQPHVLISNFQQRKT